MTPASTSRSGLSNPLAELNGNDDECGLLGAESLASEDRDSSPITDDPRRSSFFGDLPTFVGEGGAYPMG